jgi:hypothetical protein
LPLPSAHPQAPPGVHFFAQPTARRE